MSFEDIAEMQLFGNQLVNVADLGELVMRFSINILVVYVIVRKIFYRHQDDIDYQFSYFLVNICVFLVCILLSNMQLQIGFAFGLFAVFAILRYRTEQIPIREMTYLFIVIIVAVINALTHESVSLMETAFSDLVIVGSIFVLEYNWFLQRYPVKEIRYEKMELIRPDKHDLLLEDLKERTGLNVQKVEVVSISFVTNSTRLKVYYSETAGSAIWPVLLLVPFLFPFEDVTAAEVKQSSLQIRSDVSIEHNDNVFRLTSDRRSRLSSPDPRDTASGRFADMEASSEMMLSANVQLDYENERLLGRKSSVVGELAYLRFQDNDEASYFAGELALTKGFGKSSRLQARSEFTIDRFRKNYLSEATDANANGNISLGERRYAAGIYDDVEASLAYRHRIRRREKTETSPARDVDLHVAVGRLYRGYDEPFHNRDRRGMYGEIRLDLEVNSMLTLEFAYRRDDITSPGRREVLLLDESPSGFDLDINGDGAIKKNAPLLTIVDRSRIRDTFRIESTWDFNSNWRARLEYRRRQSDFSSDNPFDVDHYTSEETQERVTASVRWRFEKRWFVSGKYQYTSGEDFENLGIDEEDYRQRRITVTIQHRFQ